MKKKLIIFLICFFILLSLQNRGNAGEILATFNKETITVSEFHLLCQVPIRYNPIPTTKKQKELYLDAIIAASLVAPEIKNSRSNEDPIIKQKVKAFREYILDFLLKKKIIEEAIINKDNYKNYIPAYGDKRVRFREIVVRSKAEADTILTDIVKGKDFETIAKGKSINKNSKEGGDTGFVILGKGMYPEKTEHIIFGLNKGDVSEIVTTFEGYAIFKAIEMKDLTDREEEQLIQSLRWKVIKEKTDSLLKRLRSSVDIEIFSDNVKKMQGSDYLNDDSLGIALAKIDKTIIYFRDIINKVKGPINPLRSSQFRTITNIMEMINNEIDEILLVNEAIKMGLDKDLAFQNATKRYEEAYSADIYFHNVLFKDLKYSDEEIKKFYDENKDSPRYQNLPELIHVRHILLDDEYLAKEILKKLKDGAGFIDMARKYSIFKPSSEEDGDLGYIERGHPMIKGKEDDLFMLSEGQISKIIKSDMFQSSYYNIFKVEDRIHAGEKDYNKLKALIKYELLEKMRGKRLNEFLAPLKPTANIRKNVNLLEDF